MSGPRIVLDACVLYPTVMREVLLGVAAAGHFTPLWSPRILEEWARAAQKLGPEGAAQARGEIALLRSAWPRAEQPESPGLAARLWLPDPNDIHVLSTAVAASADSIMTLNAKDFPRALLAEETLTRVDPDSYLMSLLPAGEADLRAITQDILHTARRLSGKDWHLRPLLKKARLPRLAKALTT